MRKILFAFLSVQSADFLFDNTQLLAGEEVLYQSAEDLTEGHVLKVKGALSAMAARQEAAPATAVPEVGYRTVHLPPRKTHLVCTLRSWCIPK